MSVVFMKPVLNVVLVDVNTAVVRAWQAAFADTPEVEITHGSMLSQPVDAWVTPTNSQGSMDGGLDAVIKRFLGSKIERRVQTEIKKRFDGAMPIGSATCVPTDAELPKYLISTPTMVTSAENVSNTFNVALACAAAFQAIHQQNARIPDSITSVAIPGLGAATGRVPPRVCANLMWTGYTLFNDHDFRDYDSLRETMQEQFGAIGPRLERDRLRVKPPAVLEEHTDGCCH